MVRRHQEQHYQLHRCYPDLHRAGLPDLPGQALEEADLDKQAALRGAAGERSPDPGDKFHDEQPIFFLDQAHRPEGVVGGVRDHRADSSSRCDLQPDYRQALLPESRPLTIGVIGVPLPDLILLNSLI